ncbi:hypothetical protein [Kribbella sp. HUAS MG21]|uniref:Uncharacterized protein n=1 Tax=Kribbella sp. HUAS MG21 TaxID=3160966 RepID=A0AAU7TIV5_9ACTN
MQHINRRLVITVSVIAVAAVAVGGAFAYRIGPAEADGSAAPLTGTPTPTPTPTTTPTPNRTPVTSGTPSVRPSATSPTPTRKPPATTATVSGPTKVDVAVSKLSEGREPQVPYLVDREIRGGSGDVVKLPGTGGVIAVGRLGEGALAIVQDGNDGTVLLKTQYDQVVRRTPGVTSLVTTRDQSAAAYAAARISSLGAAVKGGTVYAETTSSVRSLKLPDSWNLQVLAFADGKVYFRSASTQDGPWSLYSWSPGASAAVKVKSVVSPTAVSANGRVAASMQTLNDAGSCSSVVEVGSGRQLFRTCDNMVSGFTPDGATAVGGSAYGDGYCDTIQVALEVSTGKLLRQWKGCFHQSVAEDDQHVLIVAVASGGGGDPGTKSAIIRCTITTGACELATPISTDKALRIGT